MEFKVIYHESGIINSTEIARGATIDCITTKQSIIIPLIVCSLTTVQNRVEQIKIELSKGIYNKGMNIQSLFPKKLRNSTFH